jgi:hypothetical protein
MNAGHWIMLGLTAALLAALWVIAVSSSPQSRFHSWARRLFWAAALLAVSGSMGGIALNGVSWIISAALGLPGYAALWVLSRL